MMSNCFDLTTHKVSEVWIPFSVRSQLIVLCVLSHMRNPQTDRGSVLREERGTNGSR